MVEDGNVEGPRAKEAGGKSESLSLPRGSSLPLPASHAKPFLFTLHPRAKAGAVSQGLKAKETDLTPSSL